MNLSCNSSETLPTNGCLFFKVSGNTMITDGTTLAYVQLVKMIMYAFLCSKVQWQGARDYKLYI